MFIGKYSMYNMFSEYKKNKHMIDAYIKNQSVEGYKKEDGKDQKKDDSTAVNEGLILGMTIGVFILFFSIGLALFVWSLWATLKYWPELSNVAKVFLVLSWLMGPPILPLIVVYVAKGLNPTPLSASSAKQLSYRFATCGM
jgi:hypothetical protein